MRIAVARKGGRACMEGRNFKRETVRAVKVKNEQGCARCSLTQTAKCVSSCWKRI